MTWRGGEGSLTREPLAPLGACEFTQILDVYCLENLRVQQICKLLQIAMPSYNEATAKRNDVDHLSALERIDIASKKWGLPDCLVMLSSSIS